MLHTGSTARHRVAVPGYLRREEAIIRRTAALQSRGSDRQQQAGSDSQRQQRAGSNSRRQRQQLAPAAGPVGPRRDRAPRAHQRGDGMRMVVILSLRWL